MPDVTFVMVWQQSQSCIGRIRKTTVIAVRTNCHIAGDLTRKWRKGYLLTSKTKQKTTTQQRINSSIKHRNIISATEQNIL